MWLAFVVMIAVLTACGAAFSFVRTDYVVLEPHRPIDLNRRLTIDGVRPEPIHGRLFLVGVEKRRVSMLQKWLLAFDPKVTLEVEPPAVSVKSELKRDKDAIRASKDIAGAVAFDALGEPPQISGSGAIVTGIDESGPARGLLKVGDRIVKLNGVDVHTSVNIVRVIGAMKPGTLVRLGFRRDNLPHIALINTAEPVADDTIHRSRIGISVTTPNLKIKLPHEVKLDTAEVVGPSAGLAFALAIYDARSPVDLVRGRYIVASGALALEGQVLEVGGMRQKAIASLDSGIELMVVPRGNVEEAREAIDQFCHTDQCTKVVGVSSVSETVRILQLPSVDLEENSARS